MADSFIQVAPDSTGKMMQTYLNTISANAVHAEAVSLVDTSGNPITTLPVSIASNINIGSNVSVTGSVTANAGTNLNTALLATNSVLSTGAQKTQIVDGSGSVIGSNANSLNVYLASITANSGTNLNTGNVSIKTFTGAANLSAGQIAATNVAGTLVAARALRRSVTIRNLDATNTGYVGVPAVTASNGMLMLPRESMTTDFTGAISVIMSSGTANFSFWETFDS